MKALDIDSPEGKPSTTATSAGPWDSPPVKKRIAIAHLP
jgi:hypothetical protein